MPAAIPLTDEMKKQAIDGYASGMGLAEVGKDIGVSHPIVARILREAGVPIRKPGPRVLTPEQERQIPRLYDEGLKYKEIADRFGCSTEPIKRVLATATETGWRRSPRRSPRRKFTADEMRRMISLYEGGASRHALSVQFDAYPYVIDEALCDAGLDLNDGRTRRGPDHPNFRYGRQVSGEGYVMVWLSEGDPLAAMRNDRGYVREHRIVMARQLGRVLYPYEQVHHRNGERADNRPENLELWETDHPAGQRPDDVPDRKHCPTCSCGG